MRLLPAGYGESGYSRDFGHAGGGGNKLDVMIEQDLSADQPISPTQSAEISKVDLQKLGHPFRS